MRGMPSAGSLSPNAERLPPPGTGADNYPTLYQNGDAQWWMLCGAWVDRVPNDSDAHEAGDVGQVLAAVHTDDEPLRSAGEGVPALGGGVGFGFAALLPLPAGVA